jgi:hypothetical protein
VNAVLGFADDDLWLAGDMGSITHFVGSAHFSAPPTNNNLFGLWGAPDGGGIWAVGMGGTILHRP